MEITDRRIEETRARLLGTNSLVTPLFLVNRKSNDDVTLDWDHKILLELSRCSFCLSITYINNKQDWPKDFWSHKWIHWCLMLWGSSLVPSSPHIVKNCRQHYPTPPALPELWHVMAPHLLTGETESQNQAWKIKLPGTHSSSCCLSPFQWPPRDK